MLSNRNIIETSKASAEFDNLTERESVLAYLPMAWVGDFIFSMGQAYWCGFCTNCPESVETMYENLHEIAPTYFFAPPRYFEQRITLLLIRMEDAGRLKKKMFDYFMEHARKVGPDLMDGKPVGLWDRFLYGIGNLCVYGPVRNRAGMARVRVAYTAGEAIGPEIFDFWRKLGINLKQLYGQTEAFLYVTAQKDGEIHADTVGKAIPDVEIRIADDGEVQFKSPGMFVGYYADDEKTKETVTEDGFVKTGDAGIFDARGDLKIIDRAKDVGKTGATGSLFAPKYIENKLKFFPNILRSGGVRRRTVRSAAASSSISI